MQMQHETDEIEIEKGFVLNTDLRIEFEYDGRGEDDIEFGEIWTTWTDYSVTPRVTKDGVRIDERDDCRLIVETAKQYVLQDISDIHGKWLDAERDNYDEYCDYKYELQKDARLEDK